VDRLNAREGDLVGEPLAPAIVHYVREECRGGDVVDELGIARRTAHNKLGALVERGVLETRKIGARGRVWWRPIPADSVDTQPPRDARQSPEKPGVDDSLTGGSARDSATGRSRARDETRPTDLGREGPETCSVTGRVSSCGGSLAVYGEEDVTDPGPLATPISSIILLHTQRQVKTTSTVLIDSV